MPILSVNFITNTYIINNYITIIDASGDGPIRLVETATTWDVIAVDDNEILATLMSIPKSVTSDAALRRQPIINLGDER